MSTFQYALGLSCIFAIVDCCSIFYLRCWRAPH